MKLLVDGDIIVFRAGFACEKTAYFLETPDGVRRFQYKKELNQFCKDSNIVDPLYETDVELEPVGNALHTVKLMLASIVERMQSNDMQVFLSGPTNYRYDVATIKPYKGNRDTAHRPTHEQAIKDFLVKNYGATYSAGEECDDVLGYTQSQLTINGDYNNSCIVSLDKDLQMIPGFHYNFVKETSHLISVDEGDYNFWKQMLTGDTTDNIPGIPGVGPKTAERFLGSSEDWDYNFMEGKVMGYYRSYYGAKWREAMTEMGRLLWIRRYPNQWWKIRMFDEQE